MTPLLEEQMPKHLTSKLVDVMKIDLKASDQEVSPQRWNGCGKRMQKQTRRRSSVCCGSIAGAVSR